MGLEALADFLGEAIVLMDRFMACCGNFAARRRAAVARAKARRPFKDIYKYIISIRNITYIRKVIIYIFIKIFSSFCFFLVCFSLFLRSKL